MRVFVFLVVLGWCALAHAKDDEEDTVVLLAAEASYEHISSDDFFALRLRAAGRLKAPRIGCDKKKEKDCTTPLRFLLEAPLHLRLQDGGIPNAGLLRQDAWDEWEEISRVLSFLSYGDARGPVMLGLGEIGPASLRHGTLLHHYFNVLTPEHHNPGARLDVMTHGVAVSGVVDNVLGPHVLAGSVAVHPGTWLGWEGIGAQWSVGVTGVMDPAAPTTLRRGGRGVEVSPTREPEVQESVPTTALGVDLDAWLWMSESLDFGVYADLNRHLDVGDGAHLGARLQARIMDVVTLGVEGEAVWIRQGYLPRYFGPLYEMERFGFAGFGVALPAPKRRVAASLNQQAVGWSATLNVEVALWNVSLDAFAADYGVKEGDGAMLLAMRAEPVDWLHIAAFYHRTNLDSWGEAFSLDGSLLSAEVRGDVLDWMYVMGRLDQTWVLQDSGAYQPTRNVVVGVGVHGAWAL